ncbi:hypothetical protein TIFTF001_031338 [Ficus carica]|uniref:Uncharacterized protein n=1 Tax=Ficus carica TaxID=3494 RepID=A0AA88J424_FICCA|nr:hypothetical protein TIFTF001_031338 [Ficus carica]
MWATSSWVPSAEERKPRSRELGALPSTPLETRPWSRRQERP